ncbi:diguanylate cyclase [Geomonas sp. RF6]|uniref:GGDEF domain-containing response regulator n=1 Tax=Geomonas sp. RF6 TaxID=2897342 RepID=UPI001E457E8E|nr:diguanylate cyclase [Geomonas sp. RF6]UFS69262.1 diguanylate cyclase [Geomonas sp. RF6]
MERILVVEDDSFFRKVFTDLLEGEGYAVETASSGEEALEMIENGDYQLVVTDMVMQDVNGLDILSHVKRHDPNVDVIMVTGHANVETAIVALKNGARDYLVKPINHDEFSHIVAQCMEQRRLLDENLELKALLNLFQVSQTIANCLELERIYPLLIDALSKAVGVSRGLGYFCGVGPLTLREVKGVDEEVAHLVGEEILACCDISESAGPLLRLKALPARVQELAPGVKEGVCLCLRHKAVLQGVVVLLNDPGVPIPRDNNSAHLHFLLDQCSLALENAARYSVAKDLLYVDELTGLYNYRYLDVVLEREMRRSERYGSHLSVLFLDIDRFKEVNDQYGHLVGSLVLKEVGDLVRKGVRDVDAVIRYGGDEYTIILVETGIEGAAIVAERIRGMVEKNVFAECEGLALKLTVSLGYACSPEDARTKSQLIDLADQAMYCGKASGRNKAFHISAKGE